jgi:MoaA/NifB/PqqE/SkfB family radical SAM enzyme
VVDTVNAMVADASAQGISVNLRRLLGHDEAMLQGVREAFAEAEDVARREGLELRLPAVVPTRERRCEFVESGGAFVSWDGDVRPCYFLWHRYHTYLGGAMKQVEPRTFGNLREQGLLAIWNSADWRRFREKVLGYDFPFCYDCNVSLCDYVDSGDFTQDCHLSAVPCGACLWCTGLFQCLQ